MDLLIKQIQKINRSIITCLLEQVCIFVEELRTILVNNIQTTEMNWLQTR